jgi:hypothetical protein
MRCISSAAIIEPSSPTVFLDRHLHYRDGKVDLELAPWAVSHSLFKAIRGRRRTHARHWLHGPARLSGQRNMRPPRLAGQVPAATSWS